MPRSGLVILPNSDFRYARFSSFCSGVRGRTGRHLNAEKYTQTFRIPRSVSHTVPTTGQNSCVMHWYKRKRATGQTPLQRRWIRSRMMLHARVPGAHRLHSVCLNLVDVLRLLLEHPGALNQVLHKQPSRWSVFYNSGGIVPSDIQQTVLTHVE